MSALNKSLEKYIPIWLKAYTVKFLAIYHLIQYNHVILISSFYCFFLHIRYVWSGTLKDWLLVL